VVLARCSLHPDWCGLANNGRAFLEMLMAACSQLPRGQGASKKKIKIISRILLMSSYVPDSAHR
jgi:hypothetical protein